MSLDPCPACGFDQSIVTDVIGEIQLLVNWPSQNTLGANTRGSNGYHYRKLRQEFANALHTQLLAFQLPVATGKRRIWFTRIYRPGKRPYDDANLRGGGKHIVDALVNRGLLIDDDNEHFEGLYKQCPGNHDSIHMRFEDYPCIQK
jgi:hypothetical protein